MSDEDVEQIKDLLKSEQLEAKENGEDFLDDIDAS